MGDELDNKNRRRPIPIPIYDTDRYSDRYIERPYLKKHELARIRDNLDKLVDIEQNESKTESEKNDFFISKTESKIPESKIPESKIPESKIPESKIPESKIPESKIPESKIPESKIPESKQIESKNDEFNIGLKNLVYNKEIKKIGVDNKKLENKKNNKIIKRKVNNMDDENYTNISPEIRRQLRKAEIKEYNDENEANKLINKSAELAEQNKKELENLKRKILEENSEIRKDFKKEFDNKFNDMTGRFDKVSSKLDETCTGIECLKKDITNVSKNLELSECPDCGKVVVPPLSSFCPNCSAKISGWADDNGEPIKNWKPSYEN